MKNTLSTTEAHKLESLEKTIQSGLQTFTDVGSALMTIRDENLFRKEFTTFDDYLKTKWGINKSYGYRLIGAAKVADTIKKSPMGDKLKAPTSERQIRPLAKVEESLQPQVWEEATKAAGSEEPTHKHVAAAAAKVTEAKRPVNVDPRDHKTEIALARIEKVLGKDVAKAIRTEVVPVTESDLRAWANNNETRMEEISSLVLENRWSPSRAIKFLDKMPNGDTTLTDLINYAITTKGKTEVQIGKWTINCKRN